VIARSRRAAVTFVAALVALVGLVALGPLVGAPAAATAPLSPGQGVEHTAAAAAGAGLARVAAVPQVARAIPAHRGGSLPMPAAPGSSVVLAGLVVVALLVAGSAGWAPRRTTGALRVRGPPAVA
jgi:hypothetical protein